MDDRVAEVLCRERPRIDRDRRPGRQRLGACSTLIDTVGDVSGDGALDVVARVASTGDLWLYKGNGRGGWLLPPTVVGRGWNIFNAVLGVGDLDGDQRSDLVARRTSDGTLYRYSGTGTGGWRAAVLVGRGWNVMSALVGAGDVNGDGRADLLARERATGYLWLYPGTGTGGFAARVRIGTGWNGLTAIVGPGDLNGDRVVDVLARDATGNLWLYPRTAAGGFSARVLVSTGWNIANADLLSPAPSARERPDDGAARHPTGVTGRS